MTNSIGLLETSGLAAAAQASNEILKENSVTLFKFELIGNGNVLICFSGEYASVKNAINIGTAESAKLGCFISSKIITKPDERVHNIIEKLNFKVTNKNEALPKKLKRSVEIPKDLLEVREGILEKADLKEPSKKIVSEVKKIKKEIVARVPKVKKKIETEINNPTILRLQKEALAKEAEVENINKSISENSIDDMSNMNVHQLRKLARSFHDFPIKGRQISKANRDELLQYLKEFNS